jgi:lysophospholipase L1-like esterase
MTRGCRVAESLSSFGRAALEPLTAIFALSVLVTCAAIGGQRQTTSVVPGASNAGAAAAPAERSVLGSVTPSAGSSEAVSPKTAASASVNHRSALGNWQQAREQLAAGQRAEPVRILWFGDSHTAADYSSNSVRRQLAQRLPLGGPGYVSLGVPGYRHGMAKAWSAGDIDVSPHPPARRSREDDGVFGLGGTRVTLRDATAYVAAKPVTAAARVAMNFELSYRLPAESDALRVSAGGQEFQLTSASTVPLAGGIRLHRFSAPSDTAVEIRVGRGKPQLFGIVMETEQTGFVIDTLGINGARFGTLLSWEEEALVQMVQQRQPVLIIVAYGTNEVFDRESVERHAQRLESVVQRLRRGAPEADCAVIGPTDVAKGGQAAHSRAAAMDAAERATAERLNCVYFSPFALIASEGGYESWARQEPPLSLSDGVHFSVRGYTRIGDAFASVLLTDR